VLTGLAPFQPQLQIWPFVIATTVTRPTLLSVTLVMFRTGVSVDCAIVACTELS
jgi:hypothetical protein